MPAPVEPPAAPASADTHAPSLSELVEGAFPATDPAWAWDKVDMAALEQQLPDNLYWEMAIPSDDELVQELRRETRAYWERQRAMVAANTATELEINDYYDYQQRLSSDYIAFAETLLNNYKSELPARDVQLMGLAKAMHSTRLKEYPAARQKALQRSALQQQERQKWLADKDAYEAKLRQSIKQ
jgi:hypothetical protein